MINKVYSLTKILSLAAASLAICALVVVSVAQAEDESDLQQMTASCHRMADKAEMHALDADTMDKYTWYNAFAACTAANGMR